MNEGAHVIAVPAAIGGDLARLARATVSSVGAFESRPMPPENVLDGWSRVVDGDPRAWYPSDSAPGPHWIQLEWDSAVEFNTLHVFFQTAKLAPARFVVEVERNGAFERVEEVAGNRHRHLVLGFDTLRTAKLRIVLDETRAICAIRLFLEQPAAVEAARRAFHTMRLPDEGPFLPWERSAAR